MRLTLLLLGLGLAAAAHAADPRKVIRVAVTSAERGFDCVRESDENTGTLCDNIFDSLLQYDHLARPIKLQPRAAVALPEVTDGGRTFRFRIKPGIYFTPDPAFKGKRRELVAADYVYSLKRFVDPKVRAQWAFLMEGKVVGLDALGEEAKRTGKFDFDKLTTLGKLTATTPGVRQPRINPEVATPGDFDTKNVDERTIVVGRRS